MVSFDIELSVKFTVPSLLLLDISSVVLSYIYNPKIIQVKIGIIKMRNCIIPAFKSYLKISLIKEKKYFQWMKFGKN